MKGYLVLSTGEQFEGELFGSDEQVFGEVVFFTGMAGYEEVMTDPSFKGQMVVFTYPLIGNYGINENDHESKKIQATALIMQDCREEGFHYESKQSLYEYAEKHRVPILVGIDTRTVVKKIRELGDMTAIITTNPAKVDFSNKPNISERDLVNEVSVKQMETHGYGANHVVMLDFGYKKSIVTTLNQLDCKVTIVPHTTDVSIIQQLKPDGIFLSNGPGNPKRLSHLLVKVKKLAESYPTMGICLGHQLLALSFGANTKKLKFGHRGANHPVIDVITNQVYVTSQNHSYVVTDTSLKDTGFSTRYVNVNDQSVEGISHCQYPITSVQFHPEAHPGPSDSEGIFQDFLLNMRNKRSATVYA